MNQEDIVHQLPGLRASVFLRAVAVAMGFLAIVCSLLFFRTMGWQILAGVLAVWGGLYFIALGWHPSIELVTRKHNACMVNCAAMCLSFAGYSYDIRTLEERLRLNKGEVGTQTQDFVWFLGSESIAFFWQMCQDISDLRRTLKVAGVPLITIVNAPILYTTLGWKFVFAPLSAWLKVARWLTKTEICHAIVVYGVANDRVLVFDPALGTLHRIRWEDLRSEMVAMSTGGDSFLAITKSNGPNSFPESLPRGLLPGTEIWDTTY